MSRRVRGWACAAAALAGCQASVTGRPVEAPPLGAARVLDPGCAGSAWSSIQDAVAAAADGDVLEICAGTYAEHVRISGKSLTLRPRDGALTVTLDGDGTGTCLEVTAGADVTVEDLGFTGGADTNAGGDVYCESSGLHVTGSLLQHGHAATGGGLAALDCDGEITGSAIQSNSADVDGGGLWSSGDGLLVEDVTVRWNTAGADGGGMYLDGSSDVLDSVFDGNSAPTNGGGLYVDHGAGEVRGNVVARNSAQDGGGVYVYYGNPTVAENTFQRNDASDEGGGLRLKLSTGPVLDNLFLRNHAAWRGGGLKVSHQATTVAGNTFVGNSAPYGGGACLVESASLLQEDAFSGNTAQDGGALYVRDGWDAIHLEDSVFQNNSASRYGGQIYLDLPFPNAIERVTLTGGSARMGGGLFAVDSGLRLDHVVLAENRATSSGGGAFLGSVTGDATNDVLWGNEAPSGSGLAVAQGGAFSVTNSVFSEQSGSSSLQLQSGTAPEVSYSDFFENDGDTAGMPGVVGSGGNLGSSPGFNDPEAGDFTLAVGSPLVDAGDPALRDEDGSRSDIGRFGGPQAW